MIANYASHGYDVIGVDTDTDLIQELRVKCNSQEAGVKDSIDCNRNYITFTTDYEAIKDTAITQIMLPSPSNSSHRFISDYVESACHSIANVLKNDEQGHTIIVSSTLMPGTMDKTIVPIFKDLTDVGVVYSPVFVAIGNIMKGLRQPDAIVIGSKEQGVDGLLTEKFLLANCDNTDVPIRHMSYVNAELSKLLLNCFITAKISLANSCAEICEKVQGGNASQVLEFLGLDKRIGSKVMMPGLGYGGTCFPRDSKALIALGQEIRLPNMLQLAIDDFNTNHDKKIFCRIVNLIRGIDNPIVSVLGLTYKTDVDLVNDSNILKIVQYLVNTGVMVRAYDPRGANNAKKALPERANLQYCNSVRYCIDNSDLVVLGTPWKEFENVDFSSMRTKQIFDCWGMWKNIQGVKYHAVGLFTNMTK